jgi:hypothetical protein
LICFCRRQKVKQFPATKTFRHPICKLHKVGVCDGKLFRENTNLWKKNSLKLAAKEYVKWLIHDIVLKKSMKNKLHGDRGWQFFVCRQNGLHFNPKNVKQYEIVHTHE